MIEGLIVSMIYIAIIAVFGWVVVMLLQKAGMPPFVTTLIWAVVALIALLILLRVVTGTALNWNGL